VEGDNIGGELVSTRSGSQATDRKGAYERVGDTVVLQGELEKVNTEAEAVAFLTFVVDIH
jgi:hypothetical protein